MKVRFLLYIVFCFLLIPAPVRAASLPSAYCSDKDVATDAGMAFPDDDCVTSYKKQKAPVCWAFAAISAAESSLLKNYPDQYRAAGLDLSEHQLVYYANHFYRNGTNLWNDVYPQLDIMKFNPQEDLGNNDMTTVSAFSAWVGPTIEDATTLADQIPTRYSKFSNDLPDAYATGKTMRQLQNAYYANVYDLDTMKKMIMKYGSGTYSYYFDSESWDGPSDSEMCLYYSGEPKSSAHEVCIIGWDDNYPRTNFCNFPQNNGAWLVKDSSSPEITEWISYENVTFSTTSTFFDFGTPADYKAYEFNYQYDSCSGNIKLKNNNAAEGSAAQMGNVFTAQEDITVKAAGFYTAGDNTEFTVRIYTNKESMKEPTDGTLSSTYSNIMEHAGYHVVSLPEAQYAKIKKGSYYSVVIDIQDTENGNPLICTGVSSRNKYIQQAYSGVSFYRFSQQEDWIDQGGKQSPYIFRIKAFADTSRHSVSVAPDSSRYAAVSCNAYSVKDGENAAFQVVPTGKYPLSSLGVLANGKLLAGSNGKYTIRGVEEDVAIRIIDPATTFRVSYDANGGTLTGASSATYTYGTGMTLGSSARREGYTFLGWEMGGRYHTGIASTDYGDKEYAAGWSANTYTIRYDANGGAGSMGDSRRTYDEAARLPSNRYTSSGKSFAGWNTKADGTGTAYGEQEKVLNLTSAANVTVTLYAQWTSHSYRIDYDANGGEGEMASLEAAYGAETRLSACEYTKTGYAFAGWNTKADGTGISYEDKEAVCNLVEENGGCITLYAQWKPITYTIHFDGNGFFLTNKDIKVTYDTAATLPWIQCPSHFGYTATGWSASRDAERYEYGERDEVMNLCSKDGGVVTLYAVFQARNFDITYKDFGDTRIDRAYTNYSYGSGLELPMDMTKTGYVFEGWYSETDGEMISSITPAMYGDRTLTGMWSPACYSISYHTCIPEDVVFEHQDYYYYGDTYALPTGLTASGYTFLGWQRFCRDADFIQGNNSITEISPEECEDIEVYAKWVDQNGNLWLPQSMGIYDGSTASPTPPTPATAKPGEDAKVTPHPGDAPKVTEPPKISPTPEPDRKETPAPGEDVKETPVPGDKPEITEPPQTTPTPDTVRKETPAQGEDARETPAAAGKTGETPAPGPAASPETPPLPDAGRMFTARGLHYKVTPEGKAIVTGCADKNRKSITIPAVIKGNGVTYEVTVIGNRAFSNMKKLKNVVIGKNITSIGKKAFYHDRKLKRIIIKSEKVSKCGKKAFQGIAKTAAVKVPSAREKVYRKLLKDSGTGGRIKIKKI